MTLSLSGVDLVQSSRSICLSKGTVYRFCGEWMASIFVVDIFQVDIFQRSWMPQSYQPLLSISYTLVVEISC